MTNYLIVLIGISLVLLLSAGTGCASLFGEESMQPTFLSSSYGTDDGMSSSWEKSRFPVHDPGIMYGNQGLNDDPQDGVFNPTGGAGGYDTGTIPKTAGDPAPVLQGSSEQPEGVVSTWITPSITPVSKDLSVNPGDEQGVWRIPSQQENPSGTWTQPVPEPVQTNPEIISGDEQGVRRIPSQQENPTGTWTQPAPEPVQTNPEIISGDEQGVWRIPSQQEPTGTWTQPAPEPVQTNPEIISGDEQGVWRIPSQQENPTGTWTQPAPEPVQTNPDWQVMPIQDPGIWRIPEQPPGSGVPCAPTVTPVPGGVFDPPGGYPSPGCNPGSGGGSSHQYPPGFHDGGDDPPREAYFPWEKYPADRWWRSSDSSYFRYHNAAILVTSSPSGANVYLRGSYKGKTPSHGYLEISDLAPGSYTIRVEHSGYSEYSENVIVSRNEVLIVDADLTKDRTTTPVQTGFLSLKSEPAGAEIYLDNRYMGVTPLTLQNIGPGMHGVVLRKAGYMDYETDVSIVAGQLALISAILPENTPPAESPVPEPTRAPVSLTILSAGLIIAIFLVRQGQNR